MNSETIPNHRNDVNIHRCDINSETIPNHRNDESIFTLPPLEH